MPSTVRWYEQVGVLPPPGRRANGYRDYDAEDLSRLRLVVALRRLGVHADEAGRLAQRCLDGGEPDPDLAATLARQRHAITRRRHELDGLEGELLDLEMTIAAAGRAGRRTTMSRPIRVLFVCTHNSARSQIAEALLEEFGGDDFEVDSAGTEATRVRPEAVTVLAEAGIDWSMAESKTIDRFLGAHFDYVVTVCDRAKATCPVFPGSENTLHWGLDDPADVVGTDEERLEAFRATRRELTARLRPFIEIALRAAGRAHDAAV